MSCPAQAPPMQGCTLRPAECPVTASSPCHLSQGKAASLCAGSPGKVVGVRSLQPQGFDGEFMGGQMERHRGHRAAGGMGKHPDCCLSPHPSAPANCSWTYNIPLIWSGDPWQLLQLIITKTRLIPRFTAWLESQGLAHSSSQSCLSIGVWPRRSCFSLVTPWLLGEQIPQLPHRAVFHCHGLWSWAG